MTGGGETGEEERLDSSLSCWSQAETAAVNHF